MSVFLKTIHEIEKEVNNIDEKYHRFTKMDKGIKKICFLTMLAERSQGAAAGHGGAVGSADWCSS